MTRDCRAMLMRFFESGLDAVIGSPAVRAWAAQNRDAQPTHILAVGKAAPAMLEGLPAHWRDTLPGLLVTKTNHLRDAVLPPRITALEASHPVPDDTSLMAGRLALEFVTSCPADSRLLLLVSGGASSLVESLRDGVDLAALTAMTNAALGSGVDIRSLNEQRRQMSRVKGGGLLRAFRGARVDVLAISDVPDDRIEVIGSGIGACPDAAGFQYDCTIIASNAVARRAIQQAAEDEGLKVIQNAETLYDDVRNLAAGIAAQLRGGPPGVYIFGGEPTVLLPPNPGQGGRNQALALEIARHLRGATDIVGLVIGTDGNDGVTDAAGAFVDGATFGAGSGADKALADADSGSYLAQRGDQVVTGPTGTNVMDLAIFIKEDGARCA